MPMLRPRTAHAPPVLRDFPDVRKLRYTFLTKIFWSHSSKATVQARQQEWQTSSPNVLNTNVVELVPVSQMYSIYVTYFSYFLLFVVDWNCFVIELLLENNLNLILNSKYVVAKHREWGNASQIRMANRLTSQCMPERKSIVFCFEFVKGGYFIFRIEYSK